MSDTKQTRAINLAGSLINFAQQLEALKASALQMQTQYNNEGVSAEWSAMATAVLNADGSIGAADGTPTAVHPITIGGINRTAAQLVAGIVLCGDLVNFMTNAAVSTALRDQTCNDLIG